MEFSRDFLGFTGIEFQISRNIPGGVSKYGELENPRSLEVFIKETIIDKWLIFQQDMFDYQVV